MRTATIYLCWSPFWLHLLYDSTKKKNLINIFYLPTIIIITTNTIRRWKISKIVNLFYLRFKMLVIMSHIYIHSHTFLIIRVYRFPFIFYIILNIKSLIFFRFNIILEDKITSYLEIMSGLYVFLSHLFLNVCKRKRLQ